MDDWKLLGDYAESRSESAFKTLVERYAALVYGSALRQVRDPELARDISQAVFLLLARKAGSLSKKTVLSGWLFQTARFVASRAIRAEQRRQRREREAVQMHDLTTTDAAWREIEPLIDDALHHLGEIDRNALLLRYVEGCSLREVGARLALSEEAAKKRVTRAVDKLRNVLARRGATLSAALIGSTLAGTLNAALPPAIFDSIAAGVTTSSASGGALAGEILKAWRWAKIRIAAGVTTGLFLVATLVIVVAQSPSNHRRGSVTSNRTAADFPLTPPA